jgi:hypothetical protein
MVASVEAQLRPGLTETDVCRLIVEAQAAHHVVQVFHQPYAWFRDCGRSNRTSPGTMSG